MTKQYPLIFHNDYMYVVERKPEGNVYVYPTALPGFITGALVEMKPTGLPGMYGSMPYPLQVIGSNNPRFKTRPSLPEIEMGIHKDAYPAYDEFMKHEKDEYTFDKDQAAHHSDGFVWGYTAASKDKKYSEEDMRKAFSSGRKFQQGGKSAKEQPERNEPDFDTLIKSLTPRPVAVEVEMETRQFSYGGAFKAAMDNGEEMEIPKVDKNNTLIIKRWIYE